MSLKAVFSHVPFIHSIVSSVIIATSSVPFSFILKVTENRVHSIHGETHGQDRCHS